MMKSLTLLLIVCSPVLLWSQIIPVEGSKLNYRLIGFTFPEEKKATNYTLQIAAGNFTDENSFSKNKCTSSNSTSNKIIAEVPLFGKEYTWRVVYDYKKGVTKIGEFHHFTTGMHAHVDTTQLRLRVTHPAENYKDGYVLADGGGVIYDMKGNPVWYLPDTEGYTGAGADMTVTKWGTITFLCRNAYEIDYNGKVLWKNPKPTITKDTILGELFHHEFTKLSNGHYMVLGMRRFWGKMATKNDSNYLLISNDHHDVRNGYKEGRFGEIIEYDANGNVVWSWLSENYLLKSDFIDFVPMDSNRRFDPHDNAFYFDEKNNVIYLGFRFLSRIIKIEYPSGKVIASYGQDFKHGDPPCVGSGLFCNQHNINFSQDGYLYFFNNNSCRYTDSMPTVEMYQEPAGPGSSFKKIWEYTCTMEGDYPKIFGSGGNAYELPDRSFFVNMGSDYSKLFIVNRDKKVLWSALPEHYIFTDGKWVPMHQYRADFISKKDMENMIWKAGK